MEVRISDSHKTSFRRILLIETRRILSMIFMPWMGIIFFCVAASCAAIYFLDLNALIAPVIKGWLLLKSFFTKTLPAWFAVPVLTTKLLAVISAVVTFIVSLLGGWKAWSAKKLARQGVRIAASESAKFVASSVFVSLLLGKERKSLKAVPRLIRRKLKTTVLGYVIRWWGKTSERNKRLSFGIVLCLVLAVAGHALIGFSILLFDLIWELALILSQWLKQSWRWFWPIVQGQLPEALVRFFTKKLLPVITNAIPVIRDDHRVMYMRLNLRLHYRSIKYLIHRYTRSHRDSVRSSISNFVSPQLQSQKEHLLNKAMDLIDQDRKRDRRR